MRKNNHNNLSKGQIIKDFEGKTKNKKNTMLISNIVYFNFWICNPTYLLLNKQGKPNSRPKLDMKLHF